MKLLSSKGIPINNQRQRRTSSNHHPKLFMSYQSQSPITNSVTPGKVNAPTRLHQRNEMHEYAFGPRKFSATKMWMYAFRLPAQRGETHTIPHWKQKHLAEEFLFGNLAWTHRAATYPRLGRCPVFKRSRYSFLFHMFCVEKIICGLLLFLFQRSVLICRLFGVLGTRSVFVSWILPDCTKGEIVKPHSAYLACYFSSFFFCKYDPNFS